MIDQAAQWDRVVDVAIVGSGAAALTAAILAHDGGAEVLIVERAGLVGGTSAVSGGVMWLPRNQHMASVGIEDSREDAIAYISRLAAGQDYDPAQVEAWVDAAPEALAYLEANTPLRMQAVPGFPDYYHPFEIPGRRPGGRSVEPVPYPTREALGDWRARVANRIADPNLGGSSTLAEDLSGRAAEITETLAERAKRDIRTKGPALVARLFRGVLDRGIDVLLETRARELVLARRVGRGQSDAENDPDRGSGIPESARNEVVGVRCEVAGAGSSRTFGARQGVVLACGGFEWNRDFVRSFIGYELQPLSPPNNEGDGLSMAMQAGAALGNMNSYWGQPAMLEPGIERDGELVPQFESGRGEPGSIIVNQAGHRFANESLPYNDFPKTFGRFDPTTQSYPNRAPAWLIFDQGVKSTTPILSVGPEDPAPDWMPTSDDIRDLARKIGIDADRLESTVARFNDHAARRQDPDFDRHRVGIMAPGRLRPIDRAPYYAVRIYPGALGTNGGPRLDPNGRVRRSSGGVVPGLYAAGNTAAGTFGGAYPSGGGTLGNGVVFGYLAGRHVASRARRKL